MLPSVTVLRCAYPCATKTNTCALCSGAYLLFALRCLPYGCVRECVRVSRITQTQGRACAHARTHARTDSQTRSHAYTGVPGSGKHGRRELVRSHKAGPALHWLRPAGAHHMTLALPLSLALSAFVLLPIYLSISHDPRRVLNYLSLTIFAVY